jgi:hypothetical protein
MKKKIALALILSMLCSMVAFADEETDMMIGIVLGIGVVATIIIIAVGGTSKDVEKLWFGEAKPETGPEPLFERVSSVTDGEAKPEKKEKKSESIFEHISFVTDGEKIYAGVRFQF